MSEAQPSPNQPPNRPESSLQYKFPLGLCNPVTGELHPDYRLLMVDADLLKSSWQHSTAHAGTRAAATDQLQMILDPEHWMETPGEAERYKNGTVPVQLSLLTVHRITPALIGPEKENSDHLQLAYLLAHPPVHGKIPVLVRAEDEEKIRWELQGTAVVPGPLAFGTQENSKFGKEVGIPTSAMTIEYVSEFFERFADAGFIGVQTQDLEHEDFQRFLTRLSGHAEPGGKRTFPPLGEAEAFAREQGLELNTYAYRFYSEGEKMGQDVFGPFQNISRNDFKSMIRGSDLPAESKEDLYALYDLARNKAAYHIIKGVPLSPNLERLIQTHLTPSAMENTFDIVLQNMQRDYKRYMETDASEEKKKAATTQFDALSGIIQHWRDPAGRKCLQRYMDRLCERQKEMAAPALEEEPILAAPAHLLAPVPLSPEEAAKLHVRQQLKRFEDAGFDGVSEEHLRLPLFQNFAEKMEAGAYPCLAAARDLMARHNHGQKNMIGLDDYAYEFTTNPQAMQVRVFGELAAIDFTAFGQILGNATLPLEQKRILRDMKNFASKLSTAAIAEGAPIDPMLRQKFERQIDPATPPEERPLDVLLKQAEATLKHCQHDKDADEDTLIYAHAAFSRMQRMVAHANSEQGRAEIQNFLDKAAARGQWRTSHGSRNIGGGGFLSQF